MDVFYNNSEKVKTLYTNYPITNVFKTRLHFFLKIKWNYDYN